MKKDLPFLNKTLRRSGGPNEEKHLYFVALSAVAGPACTLLCLIP